MSVKLWAGRFEEPTDAFVERFTSSIDVDRRLYRHDIAGSIAHCTMMAKVGMITADERDAMIDGLKQVEADIENGNFVFSDQLEDIHMHIEHHLTEKIGPVALKLHTGRSRNDQVALDTRLFMRDAVSDVISGLTGLCRVLVDLAEKHLGVVIPGYTHLQRAQPVLFSHHLMAYYEMFSRDMDRFGDCRRRIDVMPLGSAALAGTTYPIDRAYVAELLDFPAVTANSMDAVSDRDYVIEFLSAASIAMMHFSRFSEELILWSSSEFRFITLSDAFTTGSSIMPQKKNPDIPELVRGKTGSVYGHLFNLLTMMKSLPMAYNRDMQEDKKPVFEALDTLLAVIEVFTRMLPHMTVHEKNTEAATLTGFINATDLADYLASRGMPFREAHHVVGKTVAYALGAGKEIQDLTLAELRGFSGLIGDDIFGFLTNTAMIDRRTSEGGTSTENVRKAIAAAKVSFSA